MNRNMNNRSNSRRMNGPLVLIIVIGVVAGWLFGVGSLVGSTGPDIAAAAAWIPEDIAGPPLVPTLPKARSSAIFVQNDGQFDPEALYMLRHGAGQTWLAQDAIWLTVVDRQVHEQAFQAAYEAAGEKQSGNVIDLAEIPAVNIKITFAGANPQPIIESRDPRPAHMSFFMGADPAGWVTQAAVWGEVRYRDLYPGIDLILSNAPAGVAHPALPWYFEVAGDADLDAVRLQVEGPSSLSIAGGALLLESAAGSLALPLPQLLDQNGRSIEGSTLLSGPLSTQFGPNVFRVTAPFVTAGDSGFTTGLRGEEVAAAALFYSTYLGGSSGDWALGLDIDATGAAYIAGTTPSADFPTVSGSYNTTLDTQDAFLVKLNPAGTDLVYGTFYGGTASDAGNSVQVVDGQAYLTGVTSSADFPTTAGAFDTSCGTDGICNELTDAFLAKFNADGTDLLYATFIGGLDGETGSDLDISAGRATVVGTTWSKDFPTTSGAFDRTCGSDGRCDPYQGDPLNDGFLVEINPAGYGSNDLVYGTYIGGGDEDNVNGLAVSGGDAYMTGDSSSFDFPATGYVAGDDAFVVRLDPAGGGLNDLIYGTFLGGSGTDRGRSIAVSGSDAYITGDTRSSDFPVITGTFNGGFNDAFVAQLDGSGSVIYSVYLGGDDEDGGRSITLDDSGAMVIAGYTKSLSDTFPVTAEAFDATQNGQRDGFVARIFLESLAPQHITYASYLGGSGDDEIFDVAIDELGLGFLVGYTKSSTDFPTVPGSFDTTYNGGFRDGFVTTMPVGVQPGLNMQKFVNGLDADEPPGPYFVIGRPLTWTYIVTNTGLHELTNVAIMDDQLGLICSQDTLAAQEALKCQVAGTVEPDQYVNAATATGQPPSPLDPVSDIDLAHYFGAETDIRLVKRTNGVDASNQPGPLIRAGDLVSWTFVVTNTGNVLLSDIVVTDSIEGPASCPFNSLERNQSMTCTITGTAGIGLYTNTGSVIGTPPGGLAPVADQDDSHYFGADPSVVMSKKTNGVLAEHSPGPYILLGEPVTWTYIITNTGNVTLTITTVADDQGVSVNCPDSDLAIDGSVTCEGRGVAARGPYRNSALVIAAPPVGANVTATAASHYLGIEPGVIIEKLTNGEPAGELPGPYIPEGEPVTWTYLVTNTGNITLTQVTVTDDQGVVVTCDASSLGIDEALSCSASGVATSGQYENTGRVVAIPLFGPQLTATDVSHYFGSSPALTIVKRTNGVIARQQPGPFIQQGQAVTWTYQVSNSGNITLTDVAVTDDPLGLIDCPSSTLATGEEMTCQASSLAVSGQYSNSVQVAGTPPVGQDTTAGDLSHYFGVDAAIAMSKMTNGQDGESAPGPYVLVGDPVTWTYRITNTGNSLLSNIILTDDQLDEVACPKSELASGQSMLCEASGVASAGQYVNSATVTAQPPAGPEVSAGDSSHYYGAIPGISIKKLTNGHNAPTTPGPIIPAGDQVAWTYVVTNTGNIGLTGISVTDSQGVDVTCGVDVLGVGEDMPCTASDIAVSGQYSNTGRVIARPLVGPQVSAEDVSYYFGSSPALTLVKRTNGQIARTQPGPFILVGDPVMWTYQVSNSGNITLTAISLTDDSLGAVSCPAATLAVGAVMTCEQAGQAVAGQYANTATVTGKPPVGDDVSGQDLSHYFGAEPKVEIKKYTLGQDANTAPGPFIQVGDPVTWTYVISNSGNVALEGLSIWDDNGTPGDSDDDFLVCEIGSMPVATPAQHCSYTLPAVAGQYGNIGKVLATPPGTLAQISAQDASHYVGILAYPALEINKATNGVQADLAPGPYINVGDPLTWTYTIQNIGNSILQDITVVDDNGTPDDDSDDVALPACSVSSLGLFEAHSCAAAGVAVPGQYGNLATVNGIYSSTPISDSDASHYFGITPAIRIEKYTNGVDADTPPGPTLIVGLDVTWSYSVQNSGNITLTDVLVVDDNGTKLNSGDDVVVCQIVTLGPGIEEICHDSATVVLGQYANVATATGLPPTGALVSDTDKSHYLGRLGVFLPFVIRG